MSLTLKNPHSVLAVLETRPQDVIQIALPSGKLSDDWERVAGLASKKGARLIMASAPGRASQGSQGSRGKPDPSRKPEIRKSEEGGRTGGAEATVRERAPIPVEKLFQDASSRSGGTGLWLALDSLQDPHNVGAIFRAASFFGVEGVLMTQERSAPLTSTVYDVACGGVEYVPFASQISLQRAFEVAKDSGVWILGTSEHAESDVQVIPRDRPWLMVMGNEEKGLRRLTQERCDMLCRISPRGKVTSLNVSVAAGILISTLASPS